MSRSAPKSRKVKWPRPASTRTLTRFRRIAAKFDGKIVSAVWEPLFNHSRVFDGPEGGWTVKVEWPVTWAFPSGQKHRDVAVGLTVAAAIESIAWFGAEHKRLEARMAS